MWQVTQRLASIVDFWGERQVYNMHTVAELRQALSSPVSAAPVQVRAACRQCSHNIPNVSKWGQEGSP